MNVTKTVYFEIKADIIYTTITVFRIYSDVNANRLSTTKESCVNNNNIVNFVLFMLKYLNFQSKLI